MLPWDTIVDEHYCEGKTHPYLVPGIYEFFSFLGGVFLVIVGFLGMLQPHLDAIHKLLYASVCVSGIGAMLVHIRPINLFQYAAKFPMSFALCFAILNVFDDCINEFTRREANDKANGGRTAQKRAFCGLSFVNGSTFRITLYNAFILIMGGLYIMIGSIMIVFTKEFFTFDIVEIYYALPYILVIVFGLNYLTGVQHLNSTVDTSLRRLKYIAILTSLLAFGFRAIDAFACSAVSIWFFPHPFYLLFEGISFHSLIVFLSYSQATRDLYDEVALPEVTWRYILPRIRVPPKGRLGWLGSVDSPQDQQLSNLYSL